MNPSNSAGPITIHCTNLFMNQPNQSQQQTSSTTYKSSQSDSSESDLVSLFESQCMVSEKENIPNNGAMSVDTPPTGFGLDYGFCTKSVAKQNVNRMITNNLAVCRSINYDANHKGNESTWKLCSPSNRKEEDMMVQRVLRESMEQNRSAISPSTHHDHKSCNGRNGVTAPRKAECPVCLEAMDQGRNLVISLPCKHSFHDSCLKMWNDLIPYQCPECSFPVSMKNKD